MKDEGEMQQLSEFVNILKKCLRMEPDQRPDFIRLFYRNMRNLDPIRFRQHILYEERKMNCFSGTVSIYSHYNFL